MILASSQLGMAFEVPVTDIDGDVAVSICLESNFNQPQYEPELDPPLFQTVTVDNRIF